MAKEKTAYELAEELDQLLLVLPTKESQREIIKKAVERLKRLNHLED